MTPLVKQAIRTWGRACRLQAEAGELVKEFAGLLSDMREMQTENERLTALLEAYQERLGRDGGEP